MQAASSQRIVRISKELSLVLRHKPPAGLMDASGWISVPALLPHLKSKPSLDEIKLVVDSSDKKRFVLDEDTQPPRIRAAQGHSVQLSQPILEPVTSSSQVPLAVHVTSTDSWSAIQQSGELRRMSRTHIHFATGAVHMRANSWATTILRLDLGAALAAGHAFFLSANQVLLCEGPLPVSFVTLVQLGDLPEDWQQEMVASKPQFKRHKGRGGRGGGGEGRQGQQQEKPAGKEQQLQQQETEKASTQRQEQGHSGVEQEQQKQAAASAAGAAAAAAATAALKGPSKAATEQH